MDKDEATYPERIYLDGGIDPLEAEWCEFPEHPRQTYVEYVRADVALRSPQEEAGGERPGRSVLWNALARGLNAVHEFDPYDDEEWLVDVAEDAIITALARSPGGTEECRRYEGFAGIYDTFRSAEDAAEQLARYLREAEAAMPDDGMPGVSLAERIRYHVGDSDEGQAPGGTEGDDDMLELAWGLIANAWAWCEGYPDWIDAAKKWRDKYVASAAPTDDQPEATDTGADHE